MFHLLLATFGLYIALHVIIGIFMFAYVTYRSVIGFFNGKID